MTKEEITQLIKEKATKMLKPEISQWFAFKLNEFLAEGIKLGVPPHDLPLILECLVLSTTEANEATLSQEGGIDFVAGKYE